MLILEHLDNVWWKWFLFILIGQIWFRIDAKNQCKVWNTLFRVTQHIVSLPCLIFKKNRLYNILFYLCWFEDQQIILNNSISLILADTWCTWSYWNSPEWTFRNVLPLPDLATLWLPVCWSSHKEVHQSHLDFAGGSWRAPHPSMTPVRLEEPVLIVVYILILESLIVLDFNEGRYWRKKKRNVSSSLTFLSHALLYTFEYRRTCLGGILLQRARDQRATNQAK